MLFHVSPTDRWRNIAKIAGWFSVPPSALKTTTLDAARRTAMEVQMIGNAIPGGIHDGRFRC
jgi:hypothetical protein